MNALPVCGATVLQEAQLTVAGQDLSCCLPIGGTLVATSGVLRYSPPAKVPADGVYNSIVVRNGCIVGVGTENLSVYNAASCTSVPAPCGEGVSNVVSNIVLQGGSGISVIGNGSPANPYVISATGTVGGDSSTGVVYIQADNAAIIVSGSGSSSDPYTIGHKASGKFDLINGMTFDGFGHLIQYTQPTDTMGVNDVVAGYGIDVTRDRATKLVTVGLQKAANPINATLNFGKYSITFDEYNRIHKVTENSVAEGEGLRPNAYARNCYMRTQEVIPIILAEPSILKIEFDKTGSNTSGNTDSISTDTQADYAGIAVDGKQITPTITNPYRDIYFPNALYQAGEHTITVAPNTYGLITITAVWVG